MATLASLALACALVPAAAVTALAAEVEDAGAAVLRALSSDEVVASGTSGTVTWTLYGDGELVIAPTSGSTGMLDSFSDEEDVPWYEYSTDIVSVTVSDTVYGGNSLACMFEEGYYIESMDLSGLDTSQTTNMNSMFSFCKSLESLDLSGFDTSNVTDMNCMFIYCESLGSLNLSSFDTSNVTDMEDMFEHCESLESLDLSGFDASSVTDSSYMFSGCYSLKSLNFSSFSAFGVLCLHGMFRSCSSLTSLDLSSFGTSGVTGMWQMFTGCSSLATIYVSELWSTNSVTIDDYMFSGCTSLVGGNGTAYSSEHVDSEYARIDTDDTPGYFTYKAYTRNLAESSGDDSTSDSNADGAVAEGTSAKKAQSITVKAKKATAVKYSKLKKKTQSVKASKLCKVTGAKGTLTYSKISVKRNGKKASSKVAKKITVGKNGKVTLKRGLAKGTYKVKLKVKAKATSKYKASKAKTVTVTIKVK